MRADPELAQQVRQLFLTLLIGLACAYGAFVLLVAPRQDKIHKRQAHIRDIEAQAVAGQTDLLAGHLLKLAGEIRQKDQTLEILTLQEQLLREQWQHQGNEDRFHQVIFTLTGSAPVDIQPDLLKMSRKESRSMEEFTFHPVRLQGRSYFENFFLYLSFLEKSPEIGLLDGIELTAHAADPTEKSLVDFQVDLGPLEARDGL